MTISDLLVRVRLRAGLALLCMLVSPPGMAVESMVEIGDRSIRLVIPPGYIDPKMQDPALYEELRDMHEEPDMLPLLVLSQTAPNASAGSLYHQAWLTLSTPKKLLEKRTEQYAFATLKQTILARYEGEVAEAVPGLYDRLQKLINADQEEPFKLEAMVAQPHAIFYETTHALAISYAVKIMVSSDDLLLACRLIFGRMWLSVGGKVLVMDSTHMQLDEDRSPALANPLIVQSQQQVLHALGASVLQLNPSAVTAD